MRVCFLVPSLSPSGGISTVQDQAARLRDRGWDVAVLDLSDPAGRDAARDGTWDAALATWWTTIPALAGVRAARRGVFAQGFDPLHYRGEDVADRLAAS